ncbi:hypothetical protein KR222_003180, partial [Zaprionus bogoriensis]
MAGSAMPVDSLSFFRIHRTVWRILGLAQGQLKWRRLYICYSLLLHLLVTIGYPLHLLLSLFRNANLTDDIRNLTTSAICLACSLKFAIYAYNFDKLERIEHLLKLLDSRVSGQAEMDIYRQLKTQLRNILYVFIGIYLTVGLFAELSFLCQKERGLMYPAWFPLNWHDSTRNYYAAHVYQIAGIWFVLMQNWANDCYPAMMLCLISAHLQMLYSRLERVGSVPQEYEAAAHRRLEDCITDHKHLLELFGILQSFVSLPMLIQFAVTGLNVCIAIAALIFFVSEPMARTYFFFYAVGVPIQIFPTCYYGTDTELWFGRLHYAAFSCNWIEQDRSFKQKLMCFVERSLKSSTPMAGGMLRIHVDTFFSTLKFAYSLLTILLRMR